jgi:hypothetical protein
MRRVLFLLFIIPQFLEAQESSLKKIEAFTGISFSRPLGIHKEISFQSGIISELGLKYNIHLKGNNYISAGLVYSYSVYNIEGYFSKINSQDNFIITPDNVKVNTIVLAPISINVGYQKVFREKGLFGIESLASYNNKATRRYKVGASELEEKYKLNKKINLSVNGILGVILSAKRTLRLDLLLGASFTSVGANSDFHPFNCGIRFVGGIK